MARLGDHLGRTPMKIALALAAFVGMVLAITPVAAQTRAVEALRKSKPLAACAPSDRKCEVERKLKGQVYDP
jgi:hypothetical protein